MRTMKDLKATWFIENPIDQEHKQYLLLDFLKSVNQDIYDEDIYYPIKRIFSMIKELTYSRILIQEGNEISSKKLNRELETINKYIQEANLSTEEKEECLKIIESSLSILYKYAELGMELWKNIEKRIRTYDLQTAKKSDHQEYGILLFRNMASDKIYPYWWQKEKTNSGSKGGTLLKYVEIKNPYFILSYEFCVHEIIESMGLKDKRDPVITIMEVYEDFNKESVILKIAKELFIRKIYLEENQR